MEAEPKTATLRSMLIVTGGVDVTRSSACARIPAGCHMQLSARMDSLQWKDPLLAASQNLPHAAPDEFSPFAGLPTWDRATKSPFGSTAKAG
jgi:hypothetical protein